MFEFSEWWLVGVDVVRMFLELGLGRGVKIKCQGEKNWGGGEERAFIIIMESKGWVNVRNYYGFLYGWGEFKWGEQGYRRKKTRS